MRFQKYESVASGSPAAAATSASGIRIVVFRLRHHIGSQPQGAERCDGRDIEDDPHGRSPLRKPAVQVSRQELLAAKTIELGLAPAVAGKSCECDFPASLANALRTFAITADRTIRCAGASSTTLVLPAERAAVLLAKSSRLTRATDRWIPQCSMDGFIPRKTARLKQLVIIRDLNLGVAQFGEPRRHRAVKLLQRSSCTAPALSWNQGVPRVSDCALHSC